jgi:hypothetical protein
MGVGWGQIGDNSVRCGGAGNSERSHRRTGRSGLVFLFGLVFVDLVFIVFVFELDAVEQ